MKFQTKVTDPTKIEADLLAIFAWEGENNEIILSESVKKVDRQLANLLTDIIANEQFEPKKNETILLHTHGKIPSSRVLLVGLGKLNEITMVDWQNAGAVIARNAKKIHAQNVAISIPSEIISLLKAKPAGEGITVGLQLGYYSFEKYKSREILTSAFAKASADRSAGRDKEIKSVFLVSPTILDTFALGVIEGEIIACAVIYARDLVNEPSSVTTPTYLAKLAQNLAKQNKQITCTVLSEKEMKKIGMNAILGVARGSDEEAKFIHLIYQESPSHKASANRRKTICLVGKGITFDSGGLSLKPTSGMDTMKMDMAGGADILAIFSVLPKLKPKVNVVGLIAATENMPGGSAIKLGDVVTALNGKTIEIMNTDAEGRVILADALSYVDKLDQKPEAIIDLATLTGACMVALGEEVAGLFSNHNQLKEQLLKQANISGEQIWELPLVDLYKEELKSEVADLKNSTKSKYGGAITAALFLSEFVPKDIPWAHLDIAGPAWAEKDTPLRPVGGTGFGIVTLLHYLLSF